MFVYFVKLKSFKRSKIIFVDHSSQKCVFSFKLLVTDLCSDQQSLFCIWIQLVLYHIPKQYGGFLS